MEIYIYNSFYFTQYEVDDQCCSLAFLFPGDIQNDVLVLVYASGSLPF